VRRTAGPTVVCVTSLVLASFGSAAAARTVTGTVTTDPTAGAARRSSGSARTLAVHVENVRIEAPPVDVPPPAILLKFEVVNDGAGPLVNPLIRISVREKATPDATAPPRVLVRPFVLRGTPLIEPGYSIEYAMVMQNLTVECSCVAEVTVVTASELVDEGRAPIR
jgi:hypothetical protein